MLTDDFKKLGSYKYSVVSFLPDIIAGERVNIGVIVHDMQSRVLYKKFTKNVKEINRRYAFGHKGVKYTHELILSGFDEHPEIEQDKDYLLKKHREERGIYNRIFYREPYGGVLWDKQPTCKEVLEDLYDRFVIIDRKTSTK